MNLTSLTDPELETQTLHAARTEQEATLTILHHLHEVQRRRLYATRGYASLWEYVVKVLNYGESAASHRIGAMRLVFSCDEARDKIEQGTLHLSAAAAVERFIRKEQRERALIAHMARPEVHAREHVKAAVGPSSSLPWAPRRWHCLNGLKNCTTGVLKRSLRRRSRPTPPNLNPRAKSDGKSPLIRVK